MTIGKYLDLFLWTSQHLLRDMPMYEVVTLSENSVRKLSYLSSLSHAKTLGP